MDSGHGEDLCWEREAETLLATRLWPALQNQTGPVMGTQGAVPFQGSGESAATATARSPLRVTTWEGPSSRPFVG